MATLVKVSEQNYAIKDIDLIVHVTPEEIEDMALSIRPIKTDAQALDDLNA